MIQLSHISALVSRIGQNPVGKVEQMICLV